MFHLILTLSYTIPGVYLFVRILGLFISEKHRWQYVLIFGLLFSLYPLVGILGERAPRTTSIFENISNYLLPFFLYLFLLVLLTDIVLIITRISRVFEKWRIRKAVYSYRYLGLLIILSITVVIGGIINFTSIRTTTYRIKIPAGKSAISSLRIAFVSDFHLEKNVSESFIQKYIEKINDINPDILFYGGDIVEGSGNNLSSVEALLRNLRPGLGVYGILGNHDRIANFENNFFTRAGIVLLRDSAVTINNSFVVAGRNDSRNSRKDASELVAGMTDLPVIMLDHRPTDFNKISMTGTKLVFSGHTHAGQLFPLNFYLNNVYELSHGILKKNNTHFIVSSGIRLWGPRVRTVGKSEIVVAEVEFYK